MAGVWTRNYSNGLACALGGGNINSVSWNAYYGDQNIAVRSWEGNYHKASGNFPIYCWGGNAGGAIYVQSGTQGSNSTNPYIQFGTGDTAPTYDDYTLEEPVTSNFTISQSNVSVEEHKWDATNHKYYSTRRYVVQYSGASPITIKEIGLFGAISDNYDKPCLVYREVLDTPITLNQYESIIIELTQSFPIINYAPYPE